MNLRQTAIAIGLIGALGCGGVQAAEPADWSAVPATTVGLFYPGVSPIEWIVNGSAHGGWRGLKRGDSCLECHSEETGDMGKKIVSGAKIEPSPIKGKAAAIPVKVQAAHDGANLYLRFTWKQPPASGAPAMDKDNPVKVAFMLEANQVERADLSGCWETCHQDARTMPEGNKDKTKYVEGGSLASGVFYDLIQWRSNGEKHDGYIAEKRVMDGGTALVDAKGEKQGDTWTVTFTRKLTGGEGDVALASGQTVNFGMAIHDDSATGRFHHVSLGYRLGIDAEGDIQAVKQ
ncbi:MAG: hypothetical protein KDH20_17130 [Rhodocyclaceae bacterium]|nr:hypothetical protein [Rhodocyclaceae bacterium]